MKKVGKVEMLIRLIHARACDPHRSPPEALSPVSVH